MQRVKCASCILSVTRPGLLESISQPRFLLHGKAFNGNLPAMRTKYFLLLLYCFASCAADSASGVTKSIRLESVQTGQLYGPFMIRADVPVVLADGIYRIQPSEDGKAAFVSESTGKTNGPYDVTLGRIVTVGSDLYTITDIGEHETPPPPTISPEAPAAVVPAAAAPAPQPAVVPPELPAEPAPPAPVLRPAVPVAPAPASLPPAAVQKPRATPAAPVRAPTTTVKTPATPVRPPATLGSAPKTATPRPPARVERTPVTLAPREGRSYLDGMGVSLDAGVERVDYGRTLTGGTAVSDTDLRRTSASAAFRTGRLVLRGGMVLDAEWGDPVSVPDRFFDANLENGEGWWGCVEFGNRLWRADAWSLDFEVAGSHRQETYDLTYRVRQTIGTVTNAPGADGSPGAVIPLVQHVTTTQEADFRESLLKLGLVLSRATPVWSVYLGLEVVALENTELDALIATPNASYEIEFDRTDPFSATAGLSVKQWGIHWFTELSVIGEDSIRVGAALVF
jgi:hypothetical protein